MSELSLLILASVGAALAFFVAGLLLRRPRAGQTDQHTLALELDLQMARADQQRAVDALAEAQRMHEAEAGARKSEQAARVSIERERDAEKAEHLRLATREKTLADRLRAAEEAGRAALEQVESNAAAWDARWQAAQVESKRQEQTLKQELEKLRSAREAEAKEQAKLAASVQKLTAEKAEAQRAAAESARALTVAQAQSKSELAEQAQALQAEARRQSQKEAELDTREREARASAEQSAAAWRLRLERAESESETKLAGKEAEWNAKLAASEADWQARRNAREAEWQAKLAAKEAEWRAEWANKESELRAQADAAGAIKQSRAEIDRLSKELERARSDCQNEREQRQRLEIVARATEEALAAEQALAKSTAQAARGTEGRLRELDRLTEENAELRAECQRLTEEAKLGAGREGEAKDVKVELAAAQAKLAELAQVLEENRKLRDEVAELKTHQEASGELERLTAAHKQLRLDAELMARRLQELTHDQAELAPLRAQAAEASSLLQEVEYLRRREKDLEAQLYASGYFASREMPAISGELLVQTPVTDMETSLDALLVAGGPRTAVLADGQGFLIAGAGESMAQEGLAAFAGVAGDLVARARMLLPLADVNSIRLTDANRMVLSCHLFDSDGQNLEIATLGPGEPPSEETQRTIAGLAATLSAGDGADKGSK